MEIKSKSEIPNAPYYVLTNDRILSNWFGNKLISTIILPCYNEEEIEKVVRYANSRSDQRFIRTVNNKPTLRLKSHIYIH